MVTSKQVHRHKVLVQSIVDNSSDDNKSRLSRFGNCYSVVRNRRGGISLGTSFPRFDMGKALDSKIRIDWFRYHLTSDPLPDNFRTEKNARWFISAVVPFLCMLSCSGTTYQDCKITNSQSGKFVTSFHLTYQWFLLITWLFSVTTKPWQASALR